MIELVEEFIRDGRYIDVISKYEFVMKIELSIVEYIICLKEWICYCFFKDEKFVEVIRVCFEVL